MCPCSDKEGLRRRLDRLTERFALPDGSTERLERLLQLLASDRRAPTAVKDPLQAIDVHLADSLCALELTGFRDLPGLVDLGSGAGLPGAALAVAMPGSRFDLLDSSGRKCAFLEELLELLELDHARAICARAEEWGAGAGAGTYAGATARALGPLPVVLEYAAPLLRRGGRLVAWKGRRNTAEEDGARAACASLGMRLVTVEPVEPFAGSRNRHLHVYEKVSGTPAGFPRRPGMARKRPLGGRTSVDGIV